MKGLEKISAFQKVFHFPKYHFQRGWQDSKADFKNVRWRRVAAWIGFLFWVCGLPVMIIVVGLTYGEEVKSACSPDGSFNKYDKPYSLWAASGFFQITMRFGNLTFEKVKIIDIIWDIVRFYSASSCFDKLNHA